MSSDRVWIFNWFRTSNICECPISSSSFSNWTGIRKTTYKRQSVMMMMMEMTQQHSVKGRDQKNTHTKRRRRKTEENRTEETHDVEWISHYVFTSHANVSCCSRSRTLFTTFSPHTTRARKNCRHHRQRQRPRQIPKEEVRKPASFSLFSIFFLFTHNNNNSKIHQQREKRR